MASDERPEEARVRRILEGDGFNVERIPEDQQAKRADYLARRGSETYLVEVKRIDEAAWTFDAENLAMRDIPLSYRNGISKVVRDAVAQLMSTPVAVSDPLRVAWFVATGIEAEAYVEQVRATLYGAVDLIWTMGADGAKCKRCYFFTWSEFMGLPNLDAAVVGTASQGQLCINSHGRQTDRVCACALRQLFGEAALDPLAEEAAGAAFIADAASDVRDEAAMLESVKAKYGLSFLLPFKPTQHTGVAWLPGGRT